ncbi:MAG TPA: DUF4097 family beta strand repeat-containing protein [Pseudonocardiaceae bacterium]|jgi:DUF4097 and DUF4098 domain-containing protein YvlB
MPTFATPEPISVELDLVNADIRITAGTGRQTTVDIAPGDDSPAAMRVAQQTQVTFNGRTLDITQPRPKRKLFSDNHERGGVLLTIELPAGSALVGKAALVNMRVSGRLGEFRLHAAAGALDLEETGPFAVDTASGSINVTKSVGKVEVNAASGRVWFGTIDGPGAIKSVSGTIGVGDALGSLEVSGVSGGVSIEHAHTDLQARTINGTVRVGDVCKGSVVLETAAGSIEVGIKQGTAAWLDAKAMMGNVRNGLNGSDSEPVGAQNTVQLRARTQVGSIDVHRA